MCPHAPPRGHHGGGHSGTPGRSLVLARQPGADARPHDQRATGPAATASPSRDWQGPAAGRGRSHAGRCAVPAGRRRGAWRPGGRDHVPGGHAGPPRDYRSGHPRIADCRPPAAMRNPSFAPPSEPRQQLSRGVRSPQVMVAARLAAVHYHPTGPARCRAHIRTCALSGRRGCGPGPGGRLSPAREPPGNPSPEDYGCLAEHGRMTA